MTWLGPTRPAQTQVSTREVTEPSVPGSLTTSPGQRANWKGKVISLELRNPSATSRSPPGPPRPLRIPPHPS
eukprot:1038227-Alexandrium_andersonii.AAC.1